MSDASSITRWTENEGGGHRESRQAYSHKNLRLRQRHRNER